MYGTSRLNGRPGAVARASHGRRLAFGFVFAAALGLAVFRAAADEPQWLTDLPKAQAQAKADHKLVLMDFTGSDWCPPCKQLRQKVFNSPEFAAYAKTNLVLVEVDFPRSKPQSDELKEANQKLQKKFEIEGYPTTILLDAGGKQLSKSVGYDGSGSADFIANLEKARKQPQ